MKLTEFDIILTRARERLLVEWTGSKLDCKPGGFDAWVDELKLRLREELETLRNSSDSPLYCKNRWFLDNQVSPRHRADTDDSPLARFTV